MIAKVIKIIKEESRGLIICIILNICSIFNKPHHVVDPSVPKALHLLDDSELEDSQQTRHPVLMRLLNADLPSPSAEMPLQASKNTADNCTLLTRWAFIIVLFYTFYCVILK